MITYYFMITEQSNQLQVIMITDYNYHKPGYNYDWHYSLTGA